MSINEFIFDVMLLMSSGSCEVSASVNNSNNICREGKQHLLSRNTRYPRKVTTFDTIIIIIIIIFSVLIKSSHSIAVSY